MQNLISQLVNYPVYFHIEEKNHYVKQVNERSSRIVDTDQNTLQVMQGRTVYDHCNGWEGVRISDADTFNRAAKLVFNNFNN